MSQILVKKFYQKGYAIYILLLIVLVTIKNSIAPAWYDILAQVAIFIFSYVILEVFINKKVSIVTWISIFCFQVIASLIFYWINISIYNDPLGHNPVDAEFYRDLGLRFQNKSLYELYGYLLFDGNSIDDFGYPTIVYLFYKIFIDYGHELLMLFNALIISIGSCLIYKLALNFIPGIYSRLAALLWGTASFATCTTVENLKENFFSFIIIVSFFCLYKYYDNRKQIYLIISIISGICVFFFRIASGMMLLMSIISIFFISNQYIYRKLKTVIVIGGIMGILMFPIVTTFVLEQRGYDYEGSRSVTAERIEEDGGLIAVFTNFTSAFIGPIPNFVHKNIDLVKSITRYSFTAFIKMMLSFYFLYALVNFIRKRYVKMIPILIFAILNIVLLIFTFYSMHVRYHWPHIPLFLIISLWGMYNIESRKIIKYNRLYTIMICTLIILFNLR